MSYCLVATADQNANKANNYRFLYPQFKHILPEQLEAIEYIRAIGQDNMGFMWFGGRNGFARYDGYDVKVYKLSSRGVSDIVLDATGTLWFATGNGLYKYHSETDSFSIFKQRADVGLALKINHINAIKEESDGRLLLATGEGLIGFDPVSERFETLYLDDNATHAEVTEIEIDHQGRYWLGFKKQGVVVLDKQFKQQLFFKHEADNATSLGSNNVKNIFFDSQDRVWIGTLGGGINRLQADFSQFKRYVSENILNRNDIWGIQEDVSGNIWVAKSGGLMLLDEKTDEFIIYQSVDGNPLSLYQHDIRALFVDNAGDIWSGFFPTGVDLLDRQASVFENFIPIFNSDNTVLGNGVRDTYEDAQGNMWIATGYGLSRYEESSRIFTNYRYAQDKPHGISGVSLLSVRGDNDGQIWMGIWASGLNRYDPKTGVFTHYLADSNKKGALRGNQPWSLVFDEQNVLWIATNVGLNRFNASTNDFSYFSPTPEQIDGKKTFYTRVVYADKRGQIWVGSTSGLFHFDKTSETFSRFRHDENDPTTLGADFVLSIFEDSQSRLWVGTKGGGLNLMDQNTGRFKKIGLADGLLDDVITSITEDGEGLIWISSHKGLASIDPTDLSIDTYTKKEGLIGNLFNRDTFTNTRDGSIVVGSTDGFTRFDPKALWKNPYIPPVVIKQLKINNQLVDINTPGSPLEQAITHAQKLQLSHKQSVFSLSFAALNFRSPEKNQYKYILEGFDSEWLQAGNSRSVTYTNLDPGNYTFKVKGSNNSGLWNESGAELHIAISPPPWQSWWAYCLYTLLCLFVVLLAIQHYLARKRMYDSQNALNKNLIELDGLKDEFLANTSHELRTPLNGIINLTDLLIEGEDAEIDKEEKKNYLEMIKFSGKRLSNMVDAILDYSNVKANRLRLHITLTDMSELIAQVVTLVEPFVGPKPVELINHFGAHLPPVPVDAKRMETVVYNLLHNAIKFTEQGRVEIMGEVMDEQLHIQIKDTGIGIPESQLDHVFLSFEQMDGKATKSVGGTGLGLTITKELIELHGGSIEVQSVKDEGACFTIKLPLNAKPNTE